MITYVVARLVVSALAYLTGGSPHCYEDYSQCWVSTTDDHRAYIVDLDNSWYERD